MRVSAGSWVEMEAAVVADHLGEIEDVRVRVAGRSGLVYVADEVGLAAEARAAAVAPAEVVGQLPVRAGGPSARSSSNVADDTLRLRGRSLEWR